MLVSLDEVRDDLLDSQGCPGRAGRPSCRSGTDRWTVGEVRDGLVTLGEVRDVSLDRW